MLTPLYSGVCLNCVYLQREAGIRKPETQILTSKLSKTAFYISNGIMRFILQTHNLAWVFKNSCLKARKIFFLFFFFLPPKDLLIHSLPSEWYISFRMWELEGSWEETDSNPLILQMRKIWLTHLSKVPHLIVVVSGLKPRCPDS